MSNALLYEKHILSPVKRWRSRTSPRRYLPYQRKESGGAAPSDQEQLVSLQELLYAEGSTLCWSSYRGHGYQW